MSEEQISAAQEYGADQIQILEGLEAVRKRAWYVHWQYFIQGPPSSGI